MMASQTSPQKTAHSYSGMAATAFPAASEAACEILREGGNAIDAAVAAAWALSVCEPSGSGLGGQTTILIHLSTGRSLIVDGHSYAPAAVSAAKVSRSQQHLGNRACVIPSTPAALGHAHRRYGRLAHERLLGPAIRLAVNGYAITALQRRQQRWCQESLALSAATAGLFLDAGRPYEIGQTFRQPTLAASLRRLAEFGVEDFYVGRIAHAIAADMKANDGLLDAADLENFQLPPESEPLRIVYRDHEILSTPPPGGGISLLLALKLLQTLSGERDLHDLDQWYCSIAEVIRAVFHERERSPVHPQDWSPELWRDLIGPPGSERLAGIVHRSPAAMTAGVAAEEVGDTTHLCTADGEGNVVSLTQSIQSVFGAKVANPYAGFLYNNYLTTCPRRAHPFRLRARCLARSNASPTLILQPATRFDSPSRNGYGGRKPLLAIGAAGSRRILSSVLQVISAVLDRNLPLGEALAMPRIHARLSGEIWIEKDAATQSLLEKLALSFRVVQVRPALSYSMGAAQAILSRPDGLLVGAADPRRDGAALGVAR